jgi:exonuclease SbcD
LRILHTSDWHLGKKLFKKERMPEQVLFLQWLLLTIEERKPQVLVIAGDVFDTPIPTTESLSVFFQFLKDLEKLSEFNNGSLKKVLVLAGNHDSAKLLESPRPFLDKSFCKIVGQLEGPLSKEPKDIESWQEKFSVTINEEDRVTQLCLLPFFRTREILNNPWIRETQEKEDHDEVLILTGLKFWIKNLIKKETTHKILIGHHLYGSFMASGSEQGVGLSGIDSIPLSLFTDWHLLLLGHIHKNQILRKSPPAIYCGSPLPLRFSESNDKKVYFYEYSNTSDEFIPEAVDIPCYRPLLRVLTDESNFKEDILEELKKYPQSEKGLGCYLELTIKQNLPNKDILDNVRLFLKDLPIDLINFYAQIKNDIKEISKVNLQAINQKSTQELFSLFLEEHELTPPQKMTLKNSFSSLLQEQSEENHEN